MALLRFRLRTALVGVALISVPLAAVLPLFRPRTYCDAVALIKVREGDIDECTAMVRSSAVLKKALKDPAIASLPQFQATNGAETRLGASLTISPLYGFPGVEVVAKGRTPDEATEIARAVATAFVETSQSARASIDPLFGGPLNHPSVVYRWPISVLIFVGWVSFVLVLWTLARLRAMVNRQASP